MRYCKQRDRFSCGPVAIINALKFFGVKATYKDVPKYRKLTNCRRPHGVKRKYINKPLQNIFKCTKINNPTMRQLDDFLKKGYPIILSHLIRKNAKTWGHFIFIPRRERDGFVLINEYKNRTKDFVSRKFMVDMLRLKKRPGKKKRYPTAWILRGVQ